MSGEIIAALIGMVVVVVLNIGIVAFGYGRLTQRVKDYCDNLKGYDDRLKRIEAILNSHRVIIIEKGTMNELGDALASLKR